MNAGELEPALSAMLGSPLGSIGPDVWKKTPPLVAKPVLPSRRPAICWTIDRFNGSGIVRLPIRSSDGTGASNKLARVKSIITCGGALAAWHAARAMSQSLIPLIDRTNHVRAIRGKQIRNGTAL